MMIEYSEMTSFNFNSKEYQEVKRDIIECREAVHGIEWLTRNFVDRFRRAEA